MNKLLQKLTLWLIDRKIKKMEIQALKSTKARYSRKAGVVTLDIEDTKKYQALLDTRLNIEGINNPWQGAFAFYWTRRPKNAKYIEPFPELDDSRPEPLPIAPYEQYWADLDNEEFWEELAKEPYAPLEEA